MCFHMPFGGIVYDFIQVRGIDLQGNLPDDSCVDK